MVGPPRPPLAAGFLPPLEEELIADDVGDRGRGGGVGFGPRFGFVSRRVYSASRADSALVGRERLGTREGPDLLGGGINIRTIAFAESRKYGGGTSVPQPSHRRSAVQNCGW